MDYNCVPLEDRSNSSLLTRLTWNNSTTDFSGFRMDVVNTASSAESKLLDLRVGSSFGELIPTASIDKSGALFVKSLEVDGVFVVDDSGDVTMSPANATLDVNGGDIVGAANISTEALSLTGSVAASRLLASPATASGAPTFRALAVADVPAAAKVIQIARSVGTVSASGTSSFLFPSVPGVSGNVVAARLVVAADVGDFDGRYWTFAIKNKGTGGSGNTDVLATTDANKTVATDGINGGNGLTAFARSTLTLHETSANLNLLAGETLLLQLTKTSTAAALTDAVVELDVEVTA
jgi:hypothetical protein